MAEREDDAPTGLPDEDHEHPPLGPEDDEDAPEGAPAMPGIPEEGEADTAG